MILDILIPPRCVCTKAVARNFLLCADCWDKLEFITTVCDLCGAPVHFLPMEECSNCKAPVHGKSVVFYKGLSQKIITHFKYYKRYMYGTLMAQYMAKLIENDDFDSLIAVPLSFKRLLWRGYHHTAILGQGIAKLTKKPLLVDCLKKKHTKRQVDCDKEERATNVEGSFYINLKNMHKIQDQKIILVDDVITTGATIFECAKVLKQAGAVHVSFLTFARSR